MTDRELLREAVGREGASEELVRYGKKADNLEAHQRRLERQQKKLGDETLSKAERDALAARIEETQTLIGKTQTALTRMEQRPTMQEEIQKARVRWASVRRLVKNLDKRTQKN